MSQYKRLWKFQIQPTTAFSLSDNTRIDCIHFKCSHFASSFNEFYDSSTSKVNKCSPPEPAKSQIIAI